MVFNGDGDITKVTIEKARGKRPEDFYFRLPVRADTPRSRLLRSLA